MKVEEAGVNRIRIVHMGIVNVIDMKSSEGQNSKSMPPVPTVF